MADVHRFPAASPSLRPMRAFVTGGHGFVGTWLCAHLEAEGDEVVAPGGEVDVTDAAALRACMASAQPEAVYHLAGLAHVGRSWEEPGEYLRVNGMGTLSVLQAARGCAEVPRVLVVSSAEVYGRVVAADLPVTENAPLRPVSPYAASKAAAEMVSVQAHLGNGVPVIRARPFNHVGPGQSPTFVVAGMAERIVAAQREGRTELSVGNLSPRRDMTDVRDIVRAYRLLICAGQSGEAYNICSGRAVAIDDIVRRLLTLTGAALELRPDPHLVRAVDVPLMVGSPAKLRAATGWEPALPLDETLAAVVDSLRGVRPS